MHKHNHFDEASSRLSRSKSKRQVSLANKNKEKENGWNDRFHLEHIPSYRPPNNQPSQYLKNRLRLPNHKKNEMKEVRRVYETSLEKSIYAAKQTRRNQEKQKEAISKAFSDLKELWYEHSIPDCHMEIMTKIFNRENYPTKIIDNIKQQFQEISKGSALIQKVSTSITAREECLVKIHEVIRQYDQGQVSAEEATRPFEQKLSHLRILTMHCVECVYQWKKSIEMILPRNVKLVFTHNGKPYLPRIMEDYYSIINSRIAQIYTFDVKKPDVFFLNYSITGKKISNVSKNIIKRIRLCEVLLTEHHTPSQERQHSVKKSVKIRREGTNTIEDEASSNKNPVNMQESTPVASSVRVNQTWKKVEVEYSQFNNYLANCLSKSTFGSSFIKSIDMVKYEQITVFQRIESGEEIIVAIDKTASSRKIVILAIHSSINTLEGTLRSLCEYFWQHDNCAEVRTGLLHHKMGEITTVDKELSLRLKGVGFRWAMVNHSHENTQTIFSIKRPLDTVSHKRDKYKQAYPVVVEHLTTFYPATLLSSSENINLKCLPSAFALFGKVQENKPQLLESLDSNKHVVNHLKLMDSVESYQKEEAAKNEVKQYDKNFHYSGLKAFEIDSAQSRQKILKDIQLRERQASESYPHFISVVSASFNFSHPFVIHDKHTKFIPNKENQIIICQSKYPIYLLQSDQQAINFFIIEVDEAFSTDLIKGLFKVAKAIHRTWGQNHPSSTTYGSPSSGVNPIIPIPQVCTTLNSPLLTIVVLQAHQNVRAINGALKQSDLLSCLVEVMLFRSHSQETLRNVVNSILLYFNRT